MDNPIAKKDFLLELGCEELPTHAVKSLSERLAFHVEEELRLSTLLEEPSANIQVFATPRRLAIHVKNIATQQSPQWIERQGPSAEQAFDPLGNPTDMAVGFAQSCGVSPESLSIKDTEKGKRLFYKYLNPGQQAIELLPELVKRAIAKLEISRPMRWGNHTENFARPIHWLMVLFGTEVVQVTLFGQSSGNQTYGHRFHHPEPLVIPNPKDYAQILKTQGQVIANFQERKNSILNQIEQITPRGLQAKIDPELLDEVTALVEWPVALLAYFKAEFLIIPSEVLITSMQTHQRCFPLLNSFGQLQSVFVVVSNIESKNPATVIQGNERVINARLTDAAFFYQNDLKHSLESRLPHLEPLIFQKQLGSVAAKTERIVNLSLYIAKILQVDEATTQQAAQLAKCDLISEMVGEFPTLQGIMGYYYALNDQLSEECAIAIKEHYYPRFSGDALPSTIIGCIIAAADRLDTLIGIFGINQAPSGIKDPFALRRAAQGILRILLERKLALDLSELLDYTQRLYVTHLPNVAVKQQTFDFIFQRLKHIYIEQGIGPEIFEAVLACHPSQPLDFDRRLKAVCQFQTLPQASALSAAHKRVHNILKKQSATSQQIIDPLLFEYPAEAQLFEQLKIQTKMVQSLCQQGNYTQALTCLAILKDPIDHFFEKVMVMVEDKEKRNNRLALLVALHLLFTQVANISLLPDHKT